MQLQEYGTYSKCVEALRPRQRRRPDHRQHDPRRLRRPSRPQGQVQASSASTFSEENYGIGLKKGDTELCTKVTDAIKKMIADGSWQKAVTTNLGPAGFKPGAGNPPTPGACSLS